MCYHFSSSSTLSESTRTLTLEEVATVELAAVEVAPRLEVDSIGEEGSDIKVGEREVVVGKEEVRAGELGGAGWAIS